MKDVQFNTITLQKAGFERSELIFIYYGDQDAIVLMIILLLKIFTPKNVPLCTLSLHLYTSNLSGAKYMLTNNLPNHINHKKKQHFIGNLEKNHLTMIVIGQSFIIMQ